MRWAVIRAAVGATGLVVFLACGGPGTSDSTFLRRPDVDPTRENDPINKRDVPVLRQIVETTLTELVAALPEAQRAVVEGARLEVSDFAGEVNAFATCRDELPVVGISEGLIVIAARLARDKAIDEIEGTDRTRETMRTITRPEPPGPPPANRYELDREKLARQHALFVEQIAFALGHELAHHTLGHLACGRFDGRPDHPFEAIVPAFDQSKELAADAFAVTNVLSVRKDRFGYRWREQGALLVMQMVKEQRELSLREIIFAFETTHPLPEVRLPVIAATAEVWLATHAE